MLNYQRVKHIPISTWRCPNAGTPVTWDVALISSGAKRSRARFLGDLI